MYEELINIITSNLNESGTNMFYKLGNLEDHKLYKISTKIPSELKELGIDLYPLMSSNIKDEIHNTIRKELFSTINKSENVDFIDIMSSNSGLPMLFLSSESLKEVEKFIIDKNYKNIITTGKVASELQDSQSFCFFPLKENSTNGIKTNSGSVYQVGSIFGISIWVDPYLNFNEDKIIFYNDIVVDIRDIDCSIFEEYSFTPKVLISYKMSVSVDQSLVVYLVDSEKSKNFEKFLAYKSHKRNVKIDNIINE